MMNFDDILAYARSRTDQFNAATATIESLTIDPAPSTDPYRPNTHYDDADYTLRTLMIEPEGLDDIIAAPDDIDDEPYDADHDTTIALANALHTLHTLARDMPIAREYLTKLALEQSLCPMHFLDYAICFDDDDNECAAIRAIHPSHDT